MVTKHLIIPGVAKSGTTFLFDQLKKNTTVFNVPVRKETNYFVKSDTFNDWGEIWKESSVDKWYLDVSPVYLNKDKSQINNLINCLDFNKVKIFICLRNPFEQIFSHYLHDLKGLASGLDLPLKSRNYHFYSNKMKGRRFLTRFNNIRTLVEAFGANNVVGSNVETTYSNCSKEIISGLIGENLNSFDLKAQSNPGGWLPFFIYNKNKDIEYSDGKNVYVVPKGCLLSVNGDRSKLYEGFPSAKAENILIDSQTWTKELHYKNEVFQEVEDDYERICSLLNVVPEYSQKKVIVAKNAQLSESVKNQLKKISF